MTDDETDVNKYNNGGWHGWGGGGKCPVHPDSEVKTCHLALGEPTTNILSYKASDQGWENVVAFCVTKPYVKPKEPREFWITSGTLGYIHVKAKKPSDMYGYIHVKEVLDD